MSALELAGADRPAALGVFVVVDAGGESFEVVNQALDRAALDGLAAALGRNECAKLEDGLPCGSGTDPCIEFVATHRLASLSGIWRC